MRRFYLDRTQDVSGTSGIGRVAEGVEFTDGTAVLRWLTERRSTAAYLTVDDIREIHGHGGATEVVWVDDPS